MNLELDVISSFKANPCVSKVWFFWVSERFSGYPET